MKLLLIMTLTSTPAMAATVSPLLIEQFPDTIIVPDTPVCIIDPVLLPDTKCEVTE